MSRFIPKAFTFECSLLYGTESNSFAKSVLYQQLRHSSIMFDKVSIVNNKFVMESLEGQNHVGHLKTLFLTIYSRMVSLLSK